MGLGFTFFCVKSIKGASLYLNLPKTSQFSILCQSFKYSLAVISAAAAIHSQ